MSSVPTHVLRDVLQPLDRWSLDVVLLTGRHFSQFIEQGMRDVCLRKVKTANFRAPTEDKDGMLAIRGVSTTEICRTLQHGGGAESHATFAEFANALRSSHVGHLNIEGLVLTPELTTELLAQMPIRAEDVRLSVGCANLTHRQFREMMLHFSPSSLNLSSSDLLADHVTDNLLRMLRMKGLQHALFSQRNPVDGGRFGITDDAIIEFLVQQGSQADAQPPLHYAFLAVFNPSITKNLFKRLIEAHGKCMHTKKVRIGVLQSDIKVTDLKEFSLNHTRGGSGEHHIYDFPAVQLESADSTEMHLQIALFPAKDNQFIVTRARYPDSFFFKSDE